MVAKSFKQFMTRREAAARTYVGGDAGPVAELSAASGAGYVFRSRGLNRGTEAVNAVNAKGAANFGPSGTTHFDVHDSDAAGEFAYWTGYQVAEVVMNGKTVPGRLRITEIFRLTDGEWRMIHRHASMAKEG